MTNRCIFCLSETNSFSRVEHIIPESIGGDEIAPPGLVCDICNQYFGKEVEQVSLDSPVLAFERSSLCIPTKKGKYSSYEGFRFEVIGQPSGEPAVVFPPEKLKYVLKHGRGQMIVPIFGLGAITRLLLKMGLEFLAVSQAADVYSAAFDSARKAARAPDPCMRWPLAYGALRPEDRILEFGEDEEGPYQKELVYDYSVGLDSQLEMFLFFFCYSLFTFLVPLNQGDFQAAVHQLNEVNPQDYHLSLVQVGLLEGQNLPGKGEIW